MKKKLSIKIAKQLARKHFVDSGMKDGDWYFLHEKSVADVCKILGKRFKANISLLTIAAYLHDIGYSIADKDHASRSLSIIGGEYLVSDTLKDCILNHGGGKSPKTKEGKIIQIADKISFLNLDVLKALLNENPAKIKEAHLDYIQNSLNRVVDHLKKID